MAFRAMGQFFRQLNWAAPPQGEAQSDEQLLARFAASRDEGAFAEILRRHGAMVLGVCRRVLRHEQDAEDAFQASFLVLARRAASLRQRGALANWLYGVARRTALAALRAASRRRTREARTARPEAQRPQEREDLPAVLDGELAALPARYRAVLVLLDLEGKTRREAACALGIPEGTVASRLARARALLARRLVRRGVAVSAGALTVLLSESAAPARVPDALVLATVEPAQLFAAGQAANPKLITPGVAALAERVRREMMLEQFKKTAAILMVLALSALGCFVLAGGPSAPEGGAEKPSRVKEPDRAAPAPKKEDNRIHPGDRLVIQATSTLPDNPLNGVFRVEPEGTIALGPVYGRVAVKGQTLLEAQATVKSHLEKLVKKTSIQVTRYDPETGDGGEALERRVRQLEKEVRALQAAVKQLGKGN